MKTMAEIREAVKNGDLKQAHTVLEKGYTSVKSDGDVSPYKGRHGTGFVVRNHNPRSTIYRLKTYYLYA